MFIVGFLEWWYGAGWRARAGLVWSRLARVFDYFSLDLMIRTWFSPFRQIGTGQGGAALADQFRAFFDQLISRIIGAVVRTFMVVFGVITLSITLVIGLVEVVLWLFVPLTPIIGVLLFAIGWVPYVGL